MPRFGMQLWALFCLLAVCFAKKEITNVHLAMTNNIDEMVVSWQTDDSTQTNTVKYGLSANQLTSLNNQSWTWQGSYDKNAGFNHNAILTGLKEGTTYYYQCGDPNYAWSGVYNFTVRQSTLTPFTFLIYGDLGVDNSQNTITRINNMAQSNVFDFVIHLGDISYANDHPLQYEPTWNKWFGYMAPTMYNHPYMTVAGNHESWCRNPICALQTMNFTDYKYKFRMPGNESGSGTTMLWSMDYQGVHFIGLDTEQDYPGSPLDPTPEQIVDIYPELESFARKRDPLFGQRKYEEQTSYLQINWLTQDLINANANRANVPWIVVLGHRPIYSASEDYSPEGPTSTSKDIQEWLEPLLHEYNVDLFMVGHAHNYQRLYPIYNDEVVQFNYNNPNATVEIVTGAAGNREGLECFVSPLPSYLAYSNCTVYSYSLMRVYNSTHIGLEQIDSATGDIMDQFVLYKQH